MKQRNPKVKIDQIDLKSFTPEQLTVDPFWMDLYNPPEKTRKNLKRINNQSHKNII
jgi:hypothetical protein